MGAVAAVAEVAVGASLAFAARRISFYEFRLDFLILSKLRRKMAIMSKLANI